jgi:hypothetical protein
MCSSSQPNSPQEVKQTTSNIPKELMPYATKLLGQAQALTNINQNPYQAYGGQQVANINPLQTQGYTGMAGQKTAGQLGTATNLANTVGQNATNPGAYANNINQYMSPYMQNVINQQEQSAIRNYGRSLPGMDSQAAAVGGLGGTRSALMHSEANRNLQNELAGIDATGYQQAYQNAQNQFNAGQAQAIGAAQGLGQLGQTQFGQEMGINQGQIGAGAQLNAYQQKQLDTMYQNFLNQQNYPYKNLAFMSDLVRGTPTTDTATNYYASPPSTIGQIGAIAGNAMMGAKKGGRIKAYKVGGVVKGGLADGLGSLV